MTRWEMAARLTIFAILLLLESKRSNAQSAADSPKFFMGRQVTVIEHELDADRFFPKGPASVCVEGPPQRQCYTAPLSFGVGPKAVVVNLQKNTPALLFSAESSGVSGWEVHFALLQPGTGKNLENLFSNISVSNQNQHAFWNDSTVSDAPIFLTADYVWGPDEGHYGEHRYMISAYVRSIVDHLSDYYYLGDRYMTIRRYDLKKVDILTAEKPEIVARLRRIKEATPQRTPR